MRLTQGSARAQTTSPRPHPSTQAHRTQCPCPVSPQTPAREKVPEGDGGDIQGWTETKPQPRLFRKILAGGPGHPLYRTVPKCPKLDLSLAHLSAQSS